MNPPLLGFGSQLVELGVKQRVGKDVLFEEGLVDGLYLANGGADESLKGDLIDNARQSLGEVEDGVDGLWGKELGGSVGALEMEVDVGAGVIDGEASEVV